MKDQSIEFQEIKESSRLPETIRKAFRIPIEDHHKVWVLINNKQYPVLDICSGGIGISLDDDSVFTIDQTIENCELTIFNKSITGLTARIIHSSFSGSEAFHCGIQWKDMKETTASQISMIVLKMKEKLLKDDTILKEY